MATSYLIHAPIKLGIKWLESSPREQSSDERAIQNEQLYTRGIKHITRSKPTVHYHFTSPLNTLVYSLAFERLGHSKGVVIITAGGVHS